MLLVLSLVSVLKQQFNELRNGKSQTNRDQKSNLLFLQRYDQSRRFRIKLVKIDKNINKVLVFTTLDTSQLKGLMIVKIFTVYILCICLLIKQVDILKKKWK